MGGEEWGILRFRGRGRRAEVEACARGHVVVPRDIVREHGPSSQRLMRPLAMLTCFNISPIEGSVFLGKKKLR